MRLGTHLGIILWLAGLVGCAHFEGLKQFASEKAGRLLECQASDPLDLDQAEACLGQYARDLGTQSCKEAEKWLDTLPTPHEVDEGRPNE